MATQYNNTRRPSAKRRKRKKNPNNLLVIAITLFILAFAVAGALVFYIATDNNDTPSYTESVPVSKPDSEEMSLEESSTVSDIVSTPVEESSKPIIDESSEPEPPVIPNHGTAERTEAYEQYIGVEYAIDMTDYEQYVCPENEEDFVFLVNPAHPLAKDYVPENLVWCTNIRNGRPESYSYIDATANKALEAFLKEAAIAGFDDITVTNAYRSYNTQSGIFNTYVSNDIKQDYKCDHCNLYIDISYYPNKVTKSLCCNACGGKITEEDGFYYCEQCMSVADAKQQTACAACGNAVRRPTLDETTAHVLTYSTRPGTSEHQSGLCCDMHNLPATTSAFDGTPEALWLAANAHRFGFILRYPPNTQHITGIKHESWHFRFVGRTAATEIYEQGITLDEYLAE